MNFFFIRVSAGSCKFSPLQNGGGPEAARSQVDFSRSQLLILISWKYNKRKKNIFTYLSDFLGTAVGLLLTVRLDMALLLQDPSIRYAQISTMLQRPQKCERRLRTSSLSIFLIPTDFSDWLVRKALPTAQHRLRHLVITLEKWRILVQ